jgi:hypothetical protein
MAGSFDTGWQAYTGQSGIWSGWSTPVSYVAPTPIQASVKPVTGGNGSPIGQPIPTGLGMVVVPGTLVIDPKHLGGFRQSGDQVLVNLVYCLLDTQLGGTFELIWARANEQFIIRTQDPIRGITSPYRFYGGNQTTVDPMIAAFLEARYRTAWPGFVYIVFENFDIAPYENKVPVFDFQLGSDVTSQPKAEVLSTLTEGPIDRDVYENFAMAVDRTRNYQYQIYQDGSGTAQVSVVKIGTQPLPVEINRATITSATTYGFIEGAIGLDNSDYIILMTHEQSTGYVQLSLMNAFTGVIVYRLAPVLSSGTPLEPYPKHTAVLSTTSPLTYHVFCGIWTAGATAQSGLGVVVADVTNETLTWIVHPYGTPPAADGTANEDVYSLAVAGISSGERTIFFTEGIAIGHRPYVRRVKVNDSGIVSQALVYTETDATKYGHRFAVAYDFTDNGVCMYRDDGSVRKIAAGGGTVYTTGSTDPDQPFRQYRQQLRRIDRRADLSGAAWLRVRGSRRPRWKPHLPDRSV